MPRLKYTVCVNRPVLSLMWTSKQDICQSRKPGPFFFWLPLLWWISWGLQSWQICYFASLSIASLTHLIAETIADVPREFGTHFVPLISWRKGQDSRVTNLWEMLLHRFVLLSKIRGVTFLCPAGRDAALNILKELFLETHLNPILFLLVKCYTVFLPDFHVFLHITFKWFVFVVCIFFSKLYNTGIKLTACVSLIHCIWVLR